MLISAPSDGPQDRADLWLNQISVCVEGRATPVLDRVDLRIPSGIHIGIRGPSGAGKSTLLHVLSGLIAPTSGQVHCGDFCVSAADENDRDAWRRKCVGSVFQDFYLIPELDARANILLPLCFGGHSDRPRHKAEADRLIAALGLGALHGPVAQFSRGEQQRIAVARALFHRPALLLCDEPTASLDARNAMIVIDALVTGARTLGATLICASHDEAMLRRMDKIYMINNGQIAEVLP